MFLLDTNVVSILNLATRDEAPSLIDWIGRNGPKLYLSVITVMELEGGALKVERRGPSARAKHLRHFVGAISTSFSDRLLSVSSEIAVDAARLWETALPAQIDTSDLLIAATAHVHGMTVLTRNLRHFVPTGVPCHDPFASLPSR